MTRIDFVEQEGMELEKQELKALVKQYRKSYYAFLFVAAFGWLPVHVAFVIKHYKRIREARNQIKVLKENLNSRSCNGKAL